MAKIRAMERFRARLAPAALDLVESWRDHCALGKLVRRLDSQSDWQRFLDTLAEVEIARRLISACPDILVEAPTCGGKHADFALCLGGQELYVHVKRLNTDKHTRKQDNISSRISKLEKIDRPLRVSVRLQDDLTDAQMQTFVNQAFRFLSRAGVGEVFTFEPSGTRLAQCEILGEHDGTHVRLNRMSMMGFLADHERFQELLSDAYKQRMPKASNLTAITSDYPADRVDFERALLGTTFETASGPAPPSGHTAAGRLDDGFWSAGKHAECQFAVFFQFSARSGNFSSTLWIDPHAAVACDLQDSIERIFGTAESVTRRV